MTPFALALLAAAPPAWAGEGEEPAGTVALVRSGDDELAPLEERLAAELQASGFVVLTVEGPIDAERDVAGQLRELGLRHGALATLWLQVRPQARLDAWVLDEATAKAVLRTYLRPKSGAERARLALRVVELLHASLLEVRLMPKVEKAGVPPAARAAVDKRLGALDGRPHWTFGTGVGAAFTADLRPQPVLELQLGYAFSAALAAEVQLAGSVFPARVEDGRGSAADVGVAWLRVLAAWSFVRAGPFALGVLTAAGGLLWWAAGDTADPGLDARTDARLAGLLGAGVQLSLRMNEGVRLQLQAVAGASLPQVRVELAGEPRAAAGLPFIDASVRVEFE